jgi:hypothetical protein
VNGGVRLFLGLAVVGVLNATLSTPTTQAALPTVQVAPLMVRQDLAPGTVHQGYIDVANPTDSPLVLRTEVQAFRQADAAGTLVFYDSPAVTDAIQPELSEFSLGPRQALRLSYGVNAKRLPQGGTYAALFVRTATTPAQGIATAIVPEVRAGTLLFLTVGKGSRTGEVQSVHAPWLALGNRLTVKGTYANTGTAKQALAFAPSLSAGPAWGGARAEATGPFVFPGNARPFTVTLTGEYLGLVPVTVQDELGNHRTTLTLAVTGRWRWLAAMVVALGAARYLRCRYLRHRYRDPLHGRGVL